MPEPVPGWLVSDDLRPITGGHLAPLYQAGGPGELVLPPADVGPASHYLTEEQPDAIGQALADWVASAT